MFFSFCFKAWSIHWACQWEYSDQWRKYLWTCLESSPFPPTYNYVQSHQKWADTIVAHLLLFLTHCLSKIVHISTPDCNPYSTFGSVTWTCLETICIKAKIGTGNVNLLKMYLCVIYKSFFQSRNQYWAFFSMYLNNSVAVEFRLEVCCVEQKINSA